MVMMQKPREITINIKPNEDKEYLGSGSFLSMYQTFLKVKSWKNFMQSVITFLKKKYIYILLACAVEVQAQLIKV